MTPEPIGTPGGEATGPLAGIRVLDLTTILAGPYATMLLGDLGADVIKVESPMGDGSRQWGPPWAGGEAAYYLGVNRNKRGIVLDLNREDQRDKLIDLAATCDVLIENFKVETMERWGLSYEQTLRPRNARLIYCSITGYGPYGPSAHLPGFAPIIEAMSGMMSITGEPDGEPMKVGVALLDILTGTQAALGITAAVIAQRASGYGQRVEVSLLETALSALANQASSFLVSGETPLRHGNAHPAIVPYQVFDTQDRPVMVCMGTDRQYKALCEILGMPELGLEPEYRTNPDRVRNRGKLVPMLQEQFNKWTAEALAEAANARNVPIAPVNDIAQAFAHPQVTALGSITTVKHATAGSVRQVRHPIRLSRTPATIRRAPPLQGEHNIEILGESTEN